MLHNFYRASTLHPRLGAFLLKASIATMDEMDLWVTEGRRSNERQDALYAQGRTASGAVVTNAQAGESPHNWGLALDVYPSAKGGTLEPQDSSEAQIARFERLGQLARDSGLTWGGDFNSLKDRPHFEIADWRSHTGWQAIAVSVVAALVMVAYVV